MEYKKRRIAATRSRTAGKLRRISKMQGSDEDAIKLPFFLVEDVNMFV
jgi:hypothetical protein